jgi:hypothetical protein
MKKKLLLVAVGVTGMATLGTVAASAAPAAPGGTLCGNVHVVVNGQDVVNQATCQAVPPGQ